MRSFFKRPPWATRGDEDSDSEFYRRAGQTYADIIAGSKEARESPPNRAGNTPTEGGKACKRRHVSHEPISEYVASPVSDDAQEENDSKVIVSSGLEACRVSPKDGDRNGCQMLVQATADEIVGSDTSSLDHSNTRTTLNVQSTYNQPSTNNTAQIIETKKAFANHSVHCDAGNNQHPIAAYTDRYPESTHEDAIVQILITSKLQNTKPLIVHRKMSQALRDVRLAWCNRQNLPKDRHSSIFLTWKGRRLFDVTTCRSLGGEARKSPADNSIHDGYLEHGSKEGIRIHMEAVTEDAIMPTNDRQTSPTIYSALAQETAATVNEDSKPSSTRVVLKCPGFGDFSQSVSSSTQILQLIAVFRKAKRIPTNREMYLVFDGDRLDPNSRITDYGISDDDLVDVIVK
ncbi:ubiquitin-2 like Rad60 SUMO-like-domain-containing protein [Aspergillus leporis]|uniref:Ubiquitin-2 like Rad60 SUMO-like-domain-containing protein n=1 Tax=Aspergillus leporis TaxID=41062 RepID=A0A5N5WQ98_9EURO|nr:ubiquitin-2 like Rad60 SUMO-like-domain-containing protein [Aspergillus leporis]